MVPQLPTPSALHIFPKGQSQAHCLPQDLCCLPCSALQSRGWDLTRSQWRDWVCPTCSIQQMVLQETLLQNLGQEVSSVTSRGGQMDWHLGLSISSYQEWPQGSTLQGGEQSG
jgi:hypothetical protein